MFMDNDNIKSQIMQNNRLLIKGVVILFTFHLSLLTSYAQIIKDGSRWWDGERLYTAYVDEAGDVTMEGESLEMGVLGIRSITIRTLDEHRGSRLMATCPCS